MVYNQNGNHFFEFFKERRYIGTAFLFFMKKDSHPHIPAATFASLRFLSSMGLSAVVFLVSLDTEDSGFLDEAEWIIQELGIQKGQYGGLLPSQFSREVAFLVTIGSCDSKEDKERLGWIENFLMLVYAALSLPCGLVAFIDNGVVSQILSVLKSLPQSEKSDTRRCIESLLAQLLDVIIFSKPLAFDIFVDLGGVDIVFEKMSEEIACITSSATQNRIFILSLLHMVNEYVRCGKDSNCFQILRSDMFAEVYSSVYLVADCVPPSIVIEAVRILEIAINNDPATPNMLTYFLDAGIVQKAWEAADYCMKSDVGIPGTMIKDVLDFLSCLVMNFVDDDA